MKKQDLVKKLGQQLATVAAERQAAKREPALLAARTALKRYQSGRLAITHADLLAGEDTHDAADFFLEELYGAHDLSQRDVDLERIIPTLGRVLSYESLHAITEAIVLDALSERLDTAMARALGISFTEDDYLRAYRGATSFEDRSRQLALVQELGDALCELVHIPLLAITLSVMRAPAKMAGLGELQQFLERGFTTFKKMKKPAAFVATIVGRERAAMNNIYAGRAAPFEVD
jgi:hypothetical protein